MNEFEQELSDTWYDAIQAATTTTDRAAQQADHLLGMSDLGHCSEYARRMIVQEPFTDERDKSAAYIGSILGEGIEADLAKRHPDWLFQQEVVTTLPSGFQILGHPDVIRPGLVVDNKTKDGFEIVRKEPWTQQRRFQLHGYAAGAIDAGLVEEEGLMVANVFIDRSGGEHHPYVVSEPFDRQVIAEIDLWLEDVLYAVRTGTEASKDKPRDWCERWCEFYSGCRLFDTDVMGRIEDPEDLAALHVYLEGKQLAADGKRKMEQARKALVGVQGTDGRVMLRWTNVDASYVDGYMRRGYEKIDIRAIKAGEK